MQVLVVGGGGREHALAWGLSKSPEVEQIWTTGNNPGINQLARYVGGAEETIESLARWAERQRIDLTVVGPEAPLSEGIVDTFRSHGLAIMGPTRRAAELESSKAFAKETMVRAGIPTARFMVCDSAAQARDAVRQLGTPVVIKADGLAAGKGVSICHTVAEADACIVSMMEERLHGEAGSRLVVEEYLTGEEVSVLAFVSGGEVVVMPPCQDHKAVWDGDRGPNTGGMGAYTPVLAVDDAMLEDIRQRVLKPVVQTMADLGRPYSGVLYAGLMLTDRGPHVLEFNCRFGDPETQVIIPRLESSLADVLWSVATDRLAEVEVRWSAHAVACVVLASEGYPGCYPVGLPITGLDTAARNRCVQVFHAGTRREGDTVVTAGGRVLGVTAWADSLKQAVETAYDAADAIDFPGKHCRRDIAHRALIRQ
ncbi:MAG: phosphoribosylamine--glycine ligase [Limnochordia bacterium]|jgi:phosphoribosylamine--glycine ligase